MKKDIENYPDLTVKKWREDFELSHLRTKHAKGRTCVTYKKTLNHPKADPERRFMFCQKIDEFKKEGKQVMYIDESVFARHMQRTDGIHTTHQASNVMESAIVG